eukprot:scaffold29302_cov150-Isochrysis_galbana.AAC.1
MAKVLLVLAGLGAAEALAMTGRPASSRAGTVRIADIGDTGVSFQNVAREWRCKYSPGPSGGPGDSESLKACQALLAEVCRLFVPNVCPQRITRVIHAAGQPSRAPLNTPATSLRCARSL